VRPPAPEAGVSTNFTIWAVSATLSVVDGAHYTERLFNCKPPTSKKPEKFHRRSSNQLCDVDKGL
ncbi:hypothetical protein, partial [Pseudomonas sp.]|uniref:hypothetical protein n=1 Tax=Pseudomonas sp. TaxID=306 RepID=UPI0025848F8F